MGAWVVTHTHAAFDIQVPTSLLLTVSPPKGKTNMSPTTHEEGRGKGGSDGSLVRYRDDSLRDVLPRGRSDGTCGPRCHLHTF